MRSVLCMGVLRPFMATNWSHELVLLCFLTVFFLCCVNIFLLRTRRQCFGHNILLFCLSSFGAVSFECETTTGMNEASKRAKKMQFRSASWKCSIHLSSMINVHKLHLSWIYGKRQEKAHTAKQTARGWFCCRRYCVCVCWWLSH